MGIFRNHTVNILFFDKPGEIEPYIFFIITYCNPDHIHTFQGFYFCIGRRAGNVTLFAQTDILTAQVDRQRQKPYRTVL